MLLFWQEAPPKLILKGLRLKVHSASVLQALSPQEHKGAEDLAAENSREKKIIGSQAGMKLRYLGRSKESEERRKKGQDREHNWMMRKKGTGF